MFLMAKLSSFYRRPTHSIYPGMVIRAVCLRLSNLKLIVVCRFWRSRKLKVSNSPLNSRIYLNS